MIQILSFLFLAFLSPLSISQENNNHLSTTSSVINDKESINNTHQYNKELDKANKSYKKKMYDIAITQYTSLLKYSQGNDKRLGETYTKIAESYKRLKNREKTVYFYQKALDVFTILNNKKYLARTLNTLAEAERSLGNLVIALEHSTRSLEIHDSIDDPEGQAKAFTGAGIIYRNIGRYEKSIAHTHQAYLYYKETLNYNGIAKTSNEMGNLYIKLTQFKQARYFFEKTINTPKEKLSLKTLASALRQMAVIELKHKHFGSAMIYAKRAYKIYQTENEKIKESVTARIIANIYRAKKNNIKAMEYYQRAQTLAIKNNNQIHQIEAQTPLAALIFLTNYDEAMSLLFESLEIAVKLKNEKQTLYAYRTLRQAEDYQGNYKSALDYAKKEIALAKIIQKKSEDKKLTLAKINLYSHKIEIELESLRERAKLDKLELIKKNNEIEIGEQARIINELKLIKNKYASIALIFLLLICLLLIAFIYRRFKVSKQQNKQLNYLASRDSLTNCYNRRSLFEFMNKYLSKSELDEQYCIIMADIDYFKKVNDTYGHNIGDSVIRGFASILENNINENDIVARFGGEEFCIVLHKTSYQKAIVLAEDIRQKVESSIFDNVAVTCSFGVTSLKFGAANARELIEQADLALYKSKSFGRNKVTLWNESFNKN